MPLLGWFNPRLVVVFVISFVLSGTLSLIVAWSFVPAPVTYKIESKSVRPEVQGNILHIRSLLEKTELCDRVTDRNLWICDDGPQDIACGLPHKKTVWPFVRMSEVITEIGKQDIDVALFLPPAPPGPWIYESKSRYRCPMTVPFTRISLPLDHIVDTIAQFQITIPPPTAPVKDSVPFKPPKPGAVVPADVRVP